MSDENTLQTQLDEGARLLREGRVNEASAICQQLLETQGQNPEVRYFASDIQSVRGNPVAALAELEALEGPAADSPRILVRKAELLIFQGRRREAGELARQAASFATQDPRQLYSVGKTLMDAHCLEDARDLLTAGSIRWPDAAPISYLLAVTVLQLGERERALGHTLEVLKVQPQHPGALLMRSQLSEASAETNHCAELSACAAQAKNSDPQLFAVANYALRKEHADLGALADSFAALVAGADAYRSVATYDEANELAAHEDIRNTFTAKRLSVLSPGFAEAGPIFVVGLPRSGNRLIESLFGRHSKVASLGESGDFKRLLGLLAVDAAPAEVSDAEACLSVDFAALGERYVAQAKDNLQRSAPFSHMLEVTPYNFLYCGYVLSALPNARIIHMTRDYLDISYAIYRSLFFGTYGYSYDLNELASYILSYDRQMQHWHDLFPDRILDVAYEDLVCDTEAQAKRVLQYCDLEWEEGVLDFDEPLHDRYIGASRRYTTEIAPLRQRLAEGGPLYGGTIDASDPSASDTP